MVAELLRLWRHAAWADAELLRALAVVPVPADVMREYAHVLGAEEVWLARLEGRSSRTAVWPTLTLQEARVLGKAVDDGYVALIGKLDEAAVGALVTYTNSAGKTFSTAIGDILMHVALHGQYHRGKVNLMLRQAGLEPAPTDYIGYVRGVPAATQKDAKKNATKSSDKR